MFRRILLGCLVVAALAVPVSSAMARPYYRGGYYRSYGNYYRPYYRGYGSYNRGYNGNRNRPVARAGVRAGVRVGVRTFARPALGIGAGAAFF